MSIPKVNYARFEESKKINIVDYIPNYLKDSDVEVFVTFFQDYLNDLYTGVNLAKLPEDLEILEYSVPIIWTCGSNIITSPGGNFTEVFEEGDYIKRSGTDYYYKVKTIHNDTTIELVEPVKDEAGGNFSSYYDDFVMPGFNDFWYPYSESRPLGSKGSDGTVAAIYTNDTKNGRIVNIDEGSPTIQSCIVTGVGGSFELKIGFRLATGDARNNKFGIALTKSGEIITGGFQVYCENSNIYLISGGTELAKLPLHSSINEFTLNVVKSISADQWSFDLFGVESSEVTATWTDVVTGTPYSTTGTGYAYGPIVGYHNKWRKSFDMDLSDLVDFDFYFINGYKQGFNNIYFTAETGFHGYIDPTTAQVVPDPLRKFGFYQRDVILDLSKLYAVYRDINGKLRIRRIDTTLLESDNFRDGNNHISILEKIKRIIELHDPDLIDMEYIQYFANYLGYDITLNRDAIGIIAVQNISGYADMTDEEKERIEENYLRFIISNLPTWYKIKTTRNAVNILLYSFGLITDLQYFFTDNYNNGARFRLANISGDSGLPDTFFETPHFTIRVDLDGSLANFSLDPQKMDSIYKAIESIRPINTVFHGFCGWITRLFEVMVHAVSTHNMFIKIPWEEEIPVAKYFVGNSFWSTWHDDDCWSYESGGVGGAGYPTSGEIAIFDENSPGCIIDPDGGPDGHVRKIIFTGYAGEFTFSYRNIIVDEQLDADCYSTGGSFRYNNKYGFIMSGKYPSQIKTGNTWIPLLILDNDLKITANGNICCWNFNQKRGIFDLNGQTLSISNGTGEVLFGSDGVGGKLILNGGKVVAGFGYPILVNTFFNIISDGNDQWWVSGYAPINFNRKNIGKLFIGSNCTISGDVNILNKFEIHHHESVNILNGISITAGSLDFQNTPSFGGYTLIQAVTAVANGDLKTGRPYIDGIGYGDIPGRAGIWPSQPGLTSGDIIQCEGGTEYYIVNVIDSSHFDIRYLDNTIPPNACPPEDGYIAFIGRPIEVMTGTSAGIDGINEYGGFFIYPAQPYASAGDIITTSGGTKYKIISVNPSSTYFQCQYAGPSGGTPGPACPPEDYQIISIKGIRAPQRWKLICKDPLNRVYWTKFRDCDASGGFTITDIGDNNMDLGSNININFYGGE